MGSSVLCTINSYIARWKIERDVIVVLKVPIRYSFQTRYSSNNQRAMYCQNVIKSWRRITVYQFNINDDGRRSCRRLATSFPGPPPRTPCTWTIKPTFVISGLFVTYSTMNWWSCFRIYTRCKWNPSIVLCISQIL